MTRLRFVSKLNPSRAQVAALPPETEVTFAPMEAIADGGGGLDLSNIKTIGEVGSGSYSFFGEGDVLLAKVTPCFENGKKAIAQGLKNGIGFATSEVHVIRPDLSRIDASYLRYLLSSEHFRAEGMASMTGTGGLKRVSEDAILNHRLTVTNLATQKAIADFLDRETARIDQLIEKQKKLIALLEEKRSATITAAVTGQLQQQIMKSHESDTFT